MESDFTANNPFSHIPKCAHDNLLPFCSHPAVIGGVLVSSEVHVSPWTCCGQGWALTVYGPRHTQDLMWFVASTHGLRS